MAYALIKNNQVVEYPVYEGQIKALYPNVSFARPFVAPEDYVEVEDTPAPDSSYDQDLVAGAPEFIDGKWRTTWNLVPVPPEDLGVRVAAKESAVRAKRNLLLTTCDWTQLADSPVDSAMWASYRQALRDIPDQVGFPWDVTWPVDPNGNTPEPVETVIG